MEDKYLFDLTYYDGPIDVAYETPEGTIKIYSFFGYTEDKANAIWYRFYITKKQLVQFIKQELQFRNLFQNCIDNLCEKVIFDKEWNPIVLGKVDDEDRLLEEDSGLYAYNWDYTTDKANSDIQKWLKANENI